MTGLTVALTDSRSSGASVDSLTPLISPTAGLQANATFEQKINRIALQTIPIAFVLNHLDINSLVKEDLIEVYATCRKLANLFREKTPNSRQMKEMPRFDESAKVRYEEVVKYLTRGSLALGISTIHEELIKLDSDRFVIGDEFSQVIAKMKRASIVFAFHYQKAFEKAEGEAATIISIKKMQDFYTESFPKSVTCNDLFLRFISDPQAMTIEEFETKKGEFNRIKAKWYAHRVHCPKFQDALSFGTDLIVIAQAQLDSFNIIAEARKIDLQIDKESNVVLNQQHQRLASAIEHGGKFFDDGFIGFIGEMSNKIQQAKAKLSNVGKEYKFPFDNTSLRDFTILDPLAVMDKTLKERNQELESVEGKITLLSYLQEVFKGTYPLVEELHAILDIKKELVELGILARTEEDRDYRLAPLENHRFDPTNAQAREEIVSLTALEALVNKEIIAVQKAVYEIKHLIDKHPMDNLGPSVPESLEKKLAQLSCEKENDTEAVKDSRSLLASHFNQLRQRIENEKSDLAYLNTILLGYHEDYEECLRLVGSLIHHLIKSQELRKIRKDTGPHTKVGSDLCNEATLFNVDETLISLTKAKSRLGRRAVELNKYSEGVETSTNCIVQSFDGFVLNSSKSIECAKKEIARVKKSSL